MDSTASRTVTFLFADLEKGSDNLDGAPDREGAELLRYDPLFRGAMEDNG